MSKPKRTYEELCDEYLAIFAQLPLEVQNEHLRIIREFLLAHGIPTPAECLEQLRIDEIASELLRDVDLGE